jgi:hypothetical protein
MKEETMNTASMIRKYCRNTKYLICKKYPNKKIINEITAEVTVIITVQGIHRSCIMVIITFRIKRILQL